MTVEIQTGRSTYIPNEATEAQIQEFSRFLADAPSAAEHQAPQLVSQTGQTRELPADLYKVLVDVAEALSQGRGVTVMPTDTQLTTQGAADFLGMSRPSLVKLLEGGEIPFTKVGRHRRVLLSDVAAYEQSLRQKRREALQRLTAESYEDGSYFQMPGER